MSEVKCPFCNGAGWQIGIEARCCGRADAFYECGGPRCSGPEPAQVQEPCDACCGSGL